MGTNTQQLFLFLLPSPHSAVLHAGGLPGHTSSVPLMAAALQVAIPRALQGDIPMKEEGP